MIFILFIIIGVLCLYILYGNRRTYRLVAQFPGPASIPIIGNALHLLAAKSPATLYQWYQRNYYKYGKICRITFFNRVSFLIADPAVIKSILNNNVKNLDKSKSYNIMKPWLGDGLFTATSKKWHKHRKMITPVFHLKNLEQYVNVFDRHSRTLLEKLKPYAEKSEAIDIEPFITLLTLDIICEAAMGINIQAQTKQDNAYVIAGTEIAEIVSESFYKLWMQNKYLFQIFGRDKYQRYVQSIKTLYDFGESIIITRREELLKNLADTSNEKSAKESNLLLDLLLRSTIDAEPLTNQQILEEVSTFIFGGHDTTTAGLSFCLYLLSRHHFVQNKLFDEIIEVLGADKNTQITYKQLHSLKYIELVIKESFRVYAPVPCIGRLIDEDIKLDDGTIIPAGVNAVLTLFLLFKDAQYFPDPDKFDPERFRAGTNADNLSSYTFIPFSAGSRNCIGQKFAILEMKFIIVQILRHFELMPVGDAPINYLALVMRSRNGIQFGLRTRE